MSRALPHQRVPIAEAGGIASNPFYAFLQDVERALQDGTLDVSGLQAQIDAIKAQLAEEAPTIGLLLGQQSIRVIGQLKDGNSFVMLQGDSEAPGPTYAYGTDAAGVKGWHPISAAMLQGAGVVLTVGADGVTTFDLAELADSGTGTFKLITRDSYGRVSGTADGTTSDVPEGSNLYHTAARVRATVLTGLSTATNAVITATDTVLSALGKLQAQITALASTVSGLITQSITDGDTTHAPSGDAVFDALAGKASLSGGNTFTDEQVMGNVRINGSDAPLKVGGQTPIGINTLGSYAQNGNLVVEYISASTTTGWCPKFNLHRCRGTVALPEQVQNNDRLGDFQFKAYVNGAWVDGAAFGGFVDGAPGATYAPAGMRVSTSDGTSAVAFRWVFRPAGHLTPVTDNVYDIGSGSLRLREVFAANAAINTSDAREKTAPRDLTDSELAAAADIARLPSIFQWLHAIEEKGEDARLHCSPTVQSVMAVMESHGLDPFRYGFVCFDEWGEAPEIRDEETGEVTQEYRPAGDRYSLRPSELESFIAAGMAKMAQDERSARLAVEAKVASLEARLAALESA